MIYFLFVMTYEGGWNEKDEVGEDLYRGRKRKKRQK